MIEFGGKMRIFELCSVSFAYDTGIVGMNVCGINVVS